MGRSFITFIQISLLAILCSPAWASDTAVALVVESKTKQALSFHSQLQQLRSDLTIELFSSDALPDAKTFKTIPTILAMGPKALAVVLGRSDNRSRILGLFVRENAKSKLQKLYPKKRFTILDNSPTLDRQLALIKILNPQAKQVAVFHSTQYPAIPDALLKMGKALGLTIQTTELKDPLNWDRGALKSLKDADLVLGLDDSAIYNATTIRSILMRLYRASRPLVGPDKGYVRAGAVASTFSGVKETLRAISELLSSKAEWPSVIHNPYFNVSINTQVARSLNITVGNPEDLKAKVQEYLP